MQKVPMTVDEFLKMFENANLVDDNFGQRQIGPLFNISMMTNIKELEN